MTTDMQAGRLKDLTQRLNDQLAQRVAVPTESLDDYATRLQEWLRGAVAQGGAPARQAKNLLNGIWMGHPLHPALTDVPVGAWSATAIFDLVGANRAADASLKLGTLMAVPTALSGMADWADTEGPPRRDGLLHAALNTLALACFTGSIFARRSANRSLGIMLSTLGLGMATISAWIGGEMVYRLGTGVSRHAWAPRVEKFRQVMDADALAEGTLTRADLDVEGENVSLVLLRRGREVLAIHGVCSHWGGPLWEGRMDGDCVECPWHGSQFDMRTGTVKQGPAAFDQPRFEARIRAGKVEVRSVE